VPRQHPAQRGKQQPVVRLETRSTDLTAKDRQLVPKHEDLKLLCPITSSEEDDQLQQPDHDDVQRGQKQRRPPRDGIADATAAARLTRPSSCTPRAFALLAGCAPIPAPSGQTIRYRLDRSGDRQLNRALHMILFTRRRTHPATITYIQRRTREGKTSREAIRCLKRSLARNLYRLLENPPLTT
jgi:Transposase IS116/IS110/IS902 family